MFSRHSYACAPREPMCRVGRLIKGAYPLIGCTFVPREWPDVLKKVQVSEGSFRSP